MVLTPICPIIFLFAYITKVGRFPEAFIKELSCCLVTSLVCMPLLFLIAWIKQFKHLLRSFSSITKKLSPEFTSDPKYFMHFNLFHFRTI